MVSNYAPNMDAIFKEIDRRLRNLETGRRAGYTMIDQGDLQISGGRIVVNPGGASIILEEDTTTAVGSMQFTSADPTTAGNSARVYMSDSGYESVLMIQGFPGADGTISSVQLDWTRASLMTQDTSGNYAIIETFAPTTPSDIATFGSTFIVLAPGPSTSWTFYKNILNIGGLDWVADSTAGEWQARADPLSFYVPIRAASFLVGSSRLIKRDVADIPFDALAAVNAAPAQIWRYRDDYATDKLQHVSPMAEDLPPELVHEHDKVKAVDPMSLTGTLWEAVRQLSAEVSALKSQLAKMESAGTTPGTRTVSVEKSPN